MLNKAIIQGRLTKDIELKNTGTGVSVASFTVACDRDYKPEGGDRECDFLDVVAWRQTAEFAEKWFHQGDMMVIDGRLQKRKYTDNNGNNRYVVEILANNIYFGGSKRDNDSGQSNRGQAPANPYENDGFMNIPDWIDEELTFN